MMSNAERICTVFLGNKIVAQGLMAQVISDVRGNDALTDGEDAGLLVFDDATGNQIDVNWHATISDTMNVPIMKPAEEERTPRRAGRPKLGVVSGEVTLLPRQWEWLKSQPGGASVTIRKLIDEARRNGTQQSKVRASQEATYRFMTAMAGDFPQYEEALRELYGADATRFTTIIDTWSPDIANYIKRLAVDAFESE